MTISEIKSEFKNLYLGRQGIYMVRLNVDNELIIHVESDKDLNVPDTYQGVPVKILVSPMMKTF